MSILCPITEWLTHRGHSEEFEVLSPAQLKPLLRRFYIKIRTDDGKLYSKSAFVGIRASINRHLRSEPFNKRFNILTDSDFHVSNNTFKSVLKKLKNEGLDVSQPHKPISNEDLDKLRNSLVLSPDTPLSLVRKVWFDITLSFLRRGNENQGKLTPQSFVVKTDGSKRYLEMTYNEATKNHPGDANTIQHKTRMYETGTPLCPLASFEKYVSHRSEKIDALYEKPKKCVSPSDSTWYTARPLGARTLETMMKSLSADAGLSEVYTNHCVRATGITMLSNAKVPSRAIMGMSGHRCENSIRNYNSDSSSEQKREYSGILNSAIDDHTSRPVVDVRDQLGALSCADPGVDLQMPSPAASNS
jgi:hypothetical protein